MKRLLRTSFTELPVATPPKGRGAAELARRQHRRRVGALSAIALSALLHTAGGMAWWSSMQTTERDGRSVPSSAEGVVDIVLERTNAPTFTSARQRAEVWDVPERPLPPEVAPFEESEAVDVAVVDIEPQRLEGAWASGAPSRRRLEAMMTVRAIMPEPPIEVPAEDPVDSSAPDPVAVAEPPIEWPEWSPPADPASQPTEPGAVSPEPAPQAEGDTDTVVATRPEPLPTNAPPDYPRIARKRGWEGVVILSVHVLDTGVVDDAFVAVSSGCSVLDGSALDAVLDWRFEPARVDGVPIAARRDVSIRFELK